MAEPKSAKKGSFFVALEHADGRIKTLKSDCQSTQDAVAWAKANVKDLETGWVVRTGKFTSVLRPALVLREDVDEEGEQEANVGSSTVVEKPADVAEEARPVAVSPTVAQEASREAQSPSVEVQVAATPPASVVAPRAPVAIPRPAVPTVPKPPTRPSGGPIRPPAPPPRPIPVRPAVVPVPTVPSTGGDSTIV